MPENPGIPPLFRNIFNHAYLPYRDPEILRSFLKVIDEFAYNDSERLGDAYEYLLSVLGTQGKLGQFRTPRHIIDFIVAIVDPKKDEVVLDPACGTAGFLISSYKHILAANASEDGQLTLTPDERGRLVTNFKGYDIDPGMVRFSLVNMYLHEFPSPPIEEYDALTSEEKWSESADVILANPPFMSPKGGIRPHNRFSVTSKRSEVLFVDYMAEHLTANGRAGIIVPEGVIFQSQKAHKELRKMLVENYLVAVVSLPAGVFNPYSGVKTSILILDRALAKRTDGIAFFRVHNDGFDLGAQRRPIDENDLPAVQNEIVAYLHSIRANESGKAALALASGIAESKASYTLTKELNTGVVVQKLKIAENGDYNLNGERYRERREHTSTFQILPLGEVTEIIAGQSPPGASYNKAGLGTPFYQGKTEFRDIYIGEPTKWTTEPRKFADEGDILMSVRAPVGPVNLAMRLICIGRGLAAIRPDESRLLTSFAFYVLRGLEPHITGTSGVTFAAISKREIGDIQVPIPPLEVQHELVAEIEGYQKVIDGARAVVESYRPHVVVDPEWPLASIKSVATVQSGFGFPLAYQGHRNRDIPFLKVSDMNLQGNEVEITSWNNSVSDRDLKELKASSFPVGTVIFPKIGAAIATNKKRILTRVSTYDNNVIGIVPDTERLLPRYLHSWLLGFDLSKWASNAQPPSMRKTVVEGHEIPLPSLADQQSVVEEIESEYALVAANRELIDRFEKKIEAAIARVWQQA